MDVAVQIVKFNAQTNGRDKLCRLFQYISKLGWAQLQSLQKNPQLVEKLKNLETNLSATRKVLRFGKSVDMLYGGLKSMQLENIAYRLTLTLAKLNQACYLFVDHLIWAGKVGIISTDTKKWARVSARFWLVTICVNLIRDLYDLLLIAARAQRYKVKSSGQTKREVCMSDNKSVFIDTVKNIADIFLPLSSLGYIHTSTSLQGVLGIISSLAGVLVIWNPTLKLVPS